MPTLPGDVVAVAGGSPIEPDRSNDSLVAAGAGYNMGGTPATNAMGVARAAPLTSDQLRRFEAQGEDVFVGRYTPFENDFPLTGSARAGGPGRTISIPELDMLGGPTGGTVQVPVPDNVLLPGENVKGNVFFGGAGMDGSYIKDMVRAFDKQGIALTPANRDMYSSGTALDATAGVQVTRFGQLPYVPYLDNVPQVGGPQFNLIGYSYGSNVAAQVAVAYARGGTPVDNLVLIGSPISDDYLKTLQSEPNIKNVVVINLTDKGDPITAGMSDSSLVGSALTLGKQMTQGGGHFYYAPDTPVAAARRDALALYLYQRGLR